MKFVCVRYPKLQMTFRPDIKREVNGEILREPADVIRFVGGFYETEDEKKIAFIKRHSDFGHNIKVVEEHIYQKSPHQAEEEQKIIERRVGRPKKVE